VFSWTSSLTCKGINLVEEDSTRSVESGHLEKNADQLFWFTFPFGGQTGRWDIEEGRLALSGNCFGEHGLSRAWWPKHADTLPWPSDSFEVLWHQDWKQHCLLQKLLCIVQISNVIKVNLRVLVKDIPFQHLDKVDIRACTVRVLVLQEGGRFFLLLLRLLPWFVVVAVIAFTFYNFGWAASRRRLVWGTSTFVIRFFEVQVSLGLMAGAALMRGVTGLFLVFWPLFQLGRWRIPHVWVLVVVLLPLGLLPHEQLGWRVDVLIPHFWLVSVLHIVVFRLVGQVVEFKRLQSTKAGI
jgi:hypothetical protein